MKALIAGAGIAGLTTAVALRRHGIDVEIHETTAGFRNTGTGLGLACNATAALAELGIDPTGGPTGSPLRRFTIHGPTGNLVRELPIRQITAELNAPIVNIGRNDLIALLRSAAAEVPIHWNSPLRDYEHDHDGVTATFGDGVSARADVLIGADGIRSAVRARIAGDEPINEYGYVCWLAVLPFSHPNLETGVARHYWGRGTRFGLMEIGGGQVYWWGTRNVGVAAARDWHGGKAGVAAVFAGWAPEVVEVIEQTPEESIVIVPAQDRNFLPQWGDGPVTLIGDAAHPMLTSLSQGASSAIEDAVVLGHELATATNPRAGLRSYENARRERTRRLVADSRRLSQLEQLQNPLAVRLRDLAVQVTPMSMLRRQNMQPMRFQLPTQARTVAR
ncbi:FAD-dependent monooxygenase [Nocardia huaxiensis]|uniref:FAD-dependent monooxygenase n=1 Tax=Nocardia huaxiensis TaxID=2755382 RepID=A0A7D6ZT95_9NOCA|nr:FAD-dependent monooxygenase [Nocardia huaxiensis]QLY33325.1 FAD-dependent monooxygenase [Nocardia huaxiensis]UFS99769.1 FAD-dependent monooxygenase [Nocardia huaxiensis]